METNTTKGYKIAVWHYQDSNKQTDHFRGYVKVYQGATLTRVPCEEVRTGKLQAKKDADKLLKKLKQSHD